VAKRKPEDPPKGAPAWQSTFSDLMNLLLCFFVLLFSMSTVDAEKFQQVIASFSTSMSILPAGGTSIGDGEMVSAGVNQLEFLDSYYNDLANSKSQTESTTDGEDKNAVEQYEQMQLDESEKMAEEIEKQLSNSKVQDLIDVDFNGEYVTLSLSGALLFESGKAEVIDEAYPIVNKVCSVLSNYKDNIIEVEGHTDNVPMANTRKYEDNDVLSMYRALNVANYIRDTTDIDPSHIKSSGRGSYVPVADNSTPEGRAKNRRVEIKIYNSYNSNLD